MAKVASIKALEQISDQADERHKPGMQQMPGLIIVVNSGTSAPKVFGPPPALQIDGESQGAFGSKLGPRSHCVQSAAPLSD
jgi:hypothetical protein